MRLSKYEKAIRECYKQLFSESTPPLDYDKFYDDVANKRIEIEHDWFMKYYLNDERFDEIIESVAYNFKLKPIERKNLRLSIYLGHSPTTHKPIVSEI